MKNKRKKALAATKAQEAKVEGDKEGARSSIAGSIKSAGCLTFHGEEPVTSPFSLGATSLTFHGEEPATSNKPYFPWRRTSTSRGHPPVAATPRGLARLSSVLPLIAAKASLWAPAAAPKGLLYTLLVFSVSGRFRPPQGPLAAGPIPESVQKHVVVTWSFGNSGWLPSHKKHKPIILDPCNLSFVRSKVFEMQVEAQGIRNSGSRLFYYRST